MPEDYVGRPNTIPHQTQPQWAAPPGANLTNTPITTVSKPLSWANILITSLNIKGQASPSCGLGPLSKWTTIHRVLREWKIGILCLQETHLDANHVQQIETLFGRRIQIIHSPSPDNTTSTAGVTIVINKELISPLNIQTTILIPGRAIISSITWHNDQTVTIANAYAPNSPHAHAHFWTEIQNKLILHPSNPNFLLGDFNIVEDPID